MTKRIADALRALFTGPHSTVAIALVAFAVAALFAFTGIHELFELKLADLRFRLKKPVPAWDRLAYVDINEDSINAIGEYPWTRNIYAAGLNACRELRTSQTVLDIIFPDESPYQVNTAALAALQAKKGVGAAELSDLIIDHDRIFSESLAASGNAAVPYVFTTDTPTRDALAKQDRPEFQEALPGFLEKASRAIDERDKARYRGLEDMKVKELIYPIPPVMSAARSFGFVDRDSDMDGTIRKIRLVRSYKGRIYYNLALTMLMDMCRVTPASVEVEPGSHITLRNAVNPRTGAKGDIRIPVDGRGMMYINWAGQWQKSFRNVPYHALLDYDDFSGDAFDAMDQWEAARNIPEGKRAGDLYRALGEELSSPSGSAVRADGLKKSLAAAYAACARDLAKGGDKKNALAVELVSKLQSLAGTYAIVGWTAVSAHDIGVIPVQNDYPRVGIYHNAINTVLSGRFMRRPGTAATVPFMLAIAVSLGFALKRLDARKSIIAVIVSFVAVNAVVIALFIGADLWLEQFALGLSALLPSVAITSMKFIGEESQRRFIKSAFSQYLSPDVIENIIVHPEALRLGGESRTITVFFSDVQGFTSLSERMSPKELVSFLNEYLSAMTDIILSHSGTVDKYIGDAIMAFYGAPHELPDQAVRACMATIEMKRRLRELQDHWRSLGQEAIRMRIGINTGEAVVGNMGSHNRMNYTAMGDTVNLASRLEGANKFYGSSAMISESTYLLSADAVEARDLDVIRVVGKTEPIRIYELLGRKGTLPTHMNDMLDKYNRGIEYFRQKEWKQALKAFRDAVRAVPDDGPSVAYIERCEKFLKRPPSRDWDGVYTMKSK